MTPGLYLDAEGNAYIAGTEEDWSFHRSRRWLWAWRWEPDLPRPGYQQTGEWKQVYGGLFTNAQVVRDYTRSKFPPYFIVEVWESKYDSDGNPLPWTKILRKGNWSKGAVMGGPLAVTIRHGAGK